MENQTYSSCHICCQSERSVGRLDLLSDSDRLLLDNRYTWMTEWIKICVGCIERCKTQPTPITSDDESTENQPPSVITIGVSTITRATPSSLTSQVEGIDNRTIHQQVEDLLLPLLLPVPELPLPIQLALLPTGEEVSQARADHFAMVPAYIRSREEMLNARADHFARTPPNIRNRAIIHLWTLLERRTAELTRALRARRRRRHRSARHPSPPRNGYCECNRCLRAREDGIPYEWAHYFAMDEQHSHYYGDDEQ